MCSLSCNVLQQRRSCGISKLTLCCRPSSPTVCLVAAVRLRRVSLFTTQIQTCGVNLITYQILAIALVLGARAVRTSAAAGSPSLFACRLFWLPHLGSFYSHHHHLPSIIAHLLVVYYKDTNIMRALNPWTTKGRERLGSLLQHSTLSTFSLIRSRKAATPRSWALMRMSGPLTYSIVDFGYIVSEGIDDHTQHVPSLRVRGHVLSLFSHGEVSWVHWCDVFSTKCSYVELLSKISSSKKGGLGFNG